MSVDIDRMVADNIFHLPPDAPAPPYSTDMNVANQIVDWLQQARSVVVSGAGSPFVTIVGKDGSSSVTNDSPALALCLAALDYVGVAVRLG